MNELNITEAVNLWIERLSRKCKYRRANKCTFNKSEEGYCNITNCWILFKAKLRIIYKFEDLKK
jgi:hypothetical protein